MTETFFSIAYSVVTNQWIAAASDNDDLTGYGKTPMDALANLVAQIEEAANAA
ncbi:hypothetical protein SEA_NICEHOUSE_237 [Rhodococcus phage NiceHouse]|nr:hypothetical protein SEA_NICEHOUSE_237 [Rhodococcus phage NiceHouse]